MRSPLAFEARPSGCDRRRPQRRGMSRLPSRDDSVTTQLSCASCHSPLPRVRGRQRYCNPACRRRAYRDRQGQPDDIVVEPATGRRSSRVYRCPNCDTRYVGQQRCEDCNVLCTRTPPAAPAHSVRRPSPRRTAIRLTSSNSPQQRGAHASGSTPAGWGGPLPRGRDRVAGSRCGAAGIAQRRCRPGWCGVGHAGGRASPAGHVPPVAATGMTTRLPAPKEFSASCPGSARPSITGGSGPEPTRSVRSTSAVKRSGCPAARPWSPRLWLRSPSCQGKGAGGPTETLVATPGVLQHRHLSALNRPGLLGGS